MDYNLMNMLIMMMMTDRRTSFFPFRKMTNMRVWGGSSLGEEREEKEEEEEEKPLALTLASLLSSPPPPRFSLIIIFIITLSNRSFSFISSRSRSSVHRLRGEQISGTQLEEALHSKGKMEKWQLTECKDQEIRRKLYL